MDPFIIFLIVVISIVSLLLVIVSVQLMLILRNLNQTLKKVNRVIDVSEVFIHHITHPLTDVKSLGEGVKTGLYVAEQITKWLRQRSE